MGAFNEVLIEGDPLTRVQFKHGIRWQHEYRVGDTISWGSLERPPAGDGRITIAGLAADASVAGGFSYYAIVIDNDVITSVDAISADRFEELAG